MGFQGDIRIGTKDVAAALKVGLAPLPRAAVRAVEPDRLLRRQQRAGSRSATCCGSTSRSPARSSLDPGTLPDVSLRNLYLQYSQQTDRDLCLTQGLRFNADLYVGTNLPPVEHGANDAERLPHARRRPEHAPDVHRPQGPRLPGQRVRALRQRRPDGRRRAEQLRRSGRSRFDDSSLALALTPTEQQLRIKGGVRIATRDYEFARGHAPTWTSPAAASRSRATPRCSARRRPRLPRGQRAVRPAQPVVRRRGVAARGRARGARQPASAPGSRRSSRGCRRSARCWA